MLNIYKYVCVELEGVPGVLVVPGLAGGDHRGPGPGRPQAVRRYSHLAGPYKGIKHSEQVQSTKQT